MTEFASEFVLIGLVDEAIAENDEKKLDWRVNKIGGEPKISSHFSRKWGSIVQITCTDCGFLASYIGQIYCPIDTSPNDRVIYFFGCEKCNQFKVLRYSEPALEAIQSGLNRIWSTENNWSDDNNDNSHDECPNETKHKNDSKNNCVREEHVEKSGLVSFQDSNVPIFKPFYILVEEENYLKECKYHSNANFEIRTSQTIEKNCGQEEYEKSGRELFHDDCVSYKFYKSLNFIPRQVIRYSWNGSPLLNQSNLHISPSNCKNCGSLRTFEFQLMPALICLLKSEDKRQCKFDFGTILVFTCSQDCITDQLNEEKFIVLEDLDSNAIQKWASNI